MWLVSTFWVFNSFQHLMGWSVALSILGTLIFVLVQGLPYAALGLVQGLFQARGQQPGPVFNAALLTLLVVILPAPCPGSLGLGLYSLPVAIQAADLGGYPLVDFFIHLSNWLLAETLARSRQPRQCLFPLAATGVVVAGLLGYGGPRLDHFQRLERNAPRDAFRNEFLIVRTIQPDIPVPGTMAREPGSPSSGTLGVMQMLTETTAEDFPPADLILWPEVSQAVYCGCDIFEDRGMALTTRLARGPVVLACLENAHKHVPEAGNGPDATERGAPNQYTVSNTLMLVDEHQCRVVYRKHRLVPFGEAAPLRGKWPWLYDKMARQMEYLPGPGPDMFTLPNGVGVQPLICFESGFPEMTRAGVGLGAQVFANVSNDAWFLSARAAELHLSLAVFRAVEQRRPLVRGTNSGFGAHIKATGEIVPGTLTPMNERAIRQATLHIPEEITIYQRIGTAWLWPAALLVLGRIGEAFGVRPDCRRSIRQGQAVP